MNSMVKLLDITLDGLLALCMHMATGVVREYNMGVPGNKFTAVAQFKAYFFTSINGSPVKPLE